eukprot:GGOE01001942.1.p1 GENE.GGOE01001942.1~~GGOE01001942.1.p1  ORF type:complete len:707 (-),score=128.95 GGOE01001942.1:131-2251(-)
MISQLQWPIFYSAVGGMIGAVLVPLTQCTFCHPKLVSPTEGALYSDSEDLLCGFAAGTSIGNVLSVPISLAGGSPIKSAVGASGVIFLMYSPLYTLLLTGHGPRLVAHKCTSVFIGCAASATLVVVGNFYPLTIQQNIAISSAGYWVAVSWAAAFFMIAVHETSLTMVLPLYLDILFFWLAMLAYIERSNTFYTTAYLSVSTILVVPCSYYVLNVAVNTQSAVPFLYDENGDLLVPKPVPRYVADFSNDAEIIILTQRPPVTSPVMPLTPDPPPAEFLAKTKHIFVIPNYGESLELLGRTLGVLASHPNSRRRYGVYMAMEGQERGWEAKYEALHTRFRPMFFWMGFNAHFLQAGEMAGKGANVNSAVRRLVMEWDGAKPENTMLTILDSDVLITAEYVLYVDWVWASDPVAAECNVMAHMTSLIDNASELPLSIVQWDLASFTSITGQSASTSDPRFPLATYTMRLTIPMDVGYWLPGLTGIGEDQMNAVRVFIHYTRLGRTPTLVVIRVPYWCSSELTLQAKARQQVRHYLGIQIMWHSWAASRGLSLRRRMEITWRCSAPFFVAMECPLVLFSLNFLSKGQVGFETWFVVLSAWGVIGGIGAFAIARQALRLWGLSIDGNAKSKSGLWDIVQFSCILPPLFICQMFCGAHSRVWLALAEFGFTSVEYQGARQNGDDSSPKGSPGPTANVANSILSSGEGKGLV